MAGPRRKTGDRRVGQIGRVKASGIKVTAYERGQMNHPQPSTIEKHTYSTGRDVGWKYTLEERRKGERRSGVDRRTKQVSPIGEIKGTKIFGMNKAEFASHKNPPERIVSKQKLKTLGVKKGQVAFKGRRK